MFDNKKIYHKITMILLGSILVASCGNNNSGTVDQEVQDSLSFREKNDYPRNQLQQDNAKAEKPFGAYTYIIEPKDKVVPVVEGEAIDDSQQKDPKAVQTKNKEIDVPEKVPMDDFFCESG